MSWQIFREKILGLPYGLTRPLNRLSRSQQDIVWCPSFKAGSSTWKDFFIEQTGSNPFMRKPNELHLLDPFWLLSDVSSVRCK